MKKCIKALIAISLLFSTCSLFAKLPTGFYAGAAAIIDNPISGGGIFGYITDKYDFKFLGMYKKFSNNSTLPLEVPYDITARTEYSVGATFNLVHNVGQSWRLLYGPAFLYHSIKLNAIPILGFKPISGHGYTLAFRVGAQYYFSQHGFVEFGVAPVSYQLISLSDKTQVSKTKLFTGMHISLNYLF